MASLLQHFQVSINMKPNSPKNYIILCFFNFNTQNYTKKISKHNIQFSPFKLKKIEKENNNNYVCRKCNKIMLHMLVTLPATAKLCHAVCMSRIMKLLGRAERSYAAKS